MVDVHVPAGFLLQTVLIADARQFCKACMNVRASGFEYLIAAAVQRVISTKKATDARMHAYSAFLECLLCLCIQKVL